MLAVSPLAYEELTSPDINLTPPTVCYPTTGAVTLYSSSATLTLYSSSDAIAPYASSDVLETCD